jgi:hypothetical protein
MNPAVACLSPTPRKRGPTRRPCSKTHTKNRPPNPFHLCCATTTLSGVACLRSLPGSPSPVS